MSSAYTNKLACSLNDLRKENQLCDVVISVDGRDFNAHKNVLAARSSYFLAMFTSGFREASESKVNIDGKPEIFEAILDFVYTGTMKITGETASDLLEMACYMQLKEASQHIATFIQRQYTWSSNPKIPVEDSYKISEIASCHEHLKFLVSASEKHLCKSYKQLKSSDAFLQLASIDFFKTFLNRFDLSTKDAEQEVLELVVKWLKHDFENRREFAPSLLRNIRLGLVPEESRTELLSEEILGIPECKQIADSVTSHQQSGISKYKLAQKYPSLFATRSTITAKVKAVAPGETRGTFFRYFDVKDKRWKQIPSIATLSWVPSLIVINGKLHAIGGKEKTWYDRSDYWRSSDESDRSSSDDGGYSVDYRSDFLIYDPDQNRWLQCPAMKHARANPRLVYLNKCIYAIGGSTDSGERNRVECYEMAEEKWKDIASLPNTFSCTSAVAFQGSILVYGWITMHGSLQRSDTWEILVYNPSKDEWLSKFQESIVGFYKVSWPLIFLHRGQCYRVAFERTCDSKQRTVVHQLTLRSSRSSTVCSISLGEEVSQARIPPNKLGRFRIGEVMLVPLDRVVLKIGTIKKEVEESENDIAIGAWRRIKSDHDEERSNIVTFTFDIKNYM